MATDDEKDPKVKALVERDPSQPLDSVVDAQTAAQLERWFGLPSFTQVEEGEVELVHEDPEIAAIRERRKRIIEELDPLLLASLERRLTPPDDLLKFEMKIQVRDREIILFDDTGYEGGALGEPRFYERSDDIIEALNENTPQALLRDLHRPETDFDQTNSGEFVNPDPEDEPEPPFNLAREIEAVMTQRFKVEPVVIPHISTLMDDSHMEIRRHLWSDLPKRARMVNRRVTD